MFTVDGPLKSTNSNQGGRGPEELGCGSVQSSCLRPQTLAQHLNKHLECTKWKISFLKGTGQILCCWHSLLSKSYNVCNLKIKIKKFYMKMAVGWKSVFLIT